MKTTSNYKNVNTTAKAAVSEVKNAQRNILYWVRALNALANKNEFCEGVAVMDLGIICQRLLSTEVRTRMKAGQFFHASLFTRNYLGQPCTLRKVSGAILGGLIDAKGREVVSNGDGTFSALVPVSLTLAGVVSAFKYVAEKAAREQDRLEKAEKAAAKAAEKAAREHAKAQKDLRRQFLNGEISSSTYTRKVKELNAKAA